MFLDKSLFGHGGKMFRYKCDKYEFKPIRDIKYVSFIEKPSDDDENIIRNSLDDLLEEIVGEYSASDQKDALMKDISQNKIEVHGSIQLRDINKRLGINLSDSTVTTINGYILEALQEIPQAGMTFKEDNIIIEVEKVHNNYVEKATITNNG